MFRKQFLVTLFSAIGETDWKLRLAVSTTQQLENTEEIFNLDASIYAEEPQRDIHSFLGKFSLDSGN